MTLLHMVALALSVGWLGLWIVLGRQVRRQRDLVEKIEELERSP